MRIKHFVISFLAALSFTAAAHAQDMGVYAAGDVGYHWPDRIDASVAGGVRDWHWTPKDNGEGFLRLGYGLGDGFRVELEGGYRPSDWSDVEANVLIPDITAKKAAPMIPCCGTHFGPDGHINATTAMANAIYDIPLDWAVHPFVGVGAGLVHTSITEHGSFGCPICFKPAICFPSGCGINFKVDDSDDKFGWQAIGGLSLALAPQWSLDATYRYLRASGLEWNTTKGSVLFSPGHFRGDYSDNSVTVGIRYDLGGMD